MNGVVGVGAGAGGSVSGVIPLVQDRPDFIGVELIAAVAIPGLPQVSGFGDVHVGLYPFTFSDSFGGGVGDGAGVVVGFSSPTLIFTREEFENLAGSMAEAAREGARMPR